MADPTVAYVVKGWPRISELFIASELWRLEQLGVRLRLFVLKAPDETEHHPVVDRITTPPVHLPATTSLSNERVLRWLRANLRPFLPAIARTARCHPTGLARAAAAAAAQSFRARRGWRLRKIYLKELLQAVALSDHVEEAGDVGHLHAHFAHGTTTVTWLAAMICGLPFSFTGHAKDLYVGSLNPAGLLPRKAAAAAFVVTCTGANLEHLRRIAPASDLHLVHHGLNAEFASLLNGTTPTPPDGRFRVVSVGRLVPKKGFDVLIEAVARLHERGVDVELDIAGEDGPEAGDIARRILDAGLLDRVTVRGPLTQAALLELYQRSSCFALACRVDDDGDRDGIPNVLVEAMAAGLPVISTDVSGIPELIAHDADGLLVPPDDPDALADALLRLAKDPALAARLAEAGRQTVAQSFDGDVLARRLAALFRNGRR